MIWKKAEFSITFHDSCTFSFQLFTQILNFSVFKQVFACIDFFLNTMIQLFASFLKITISLPKFMHLIGFLHCLARNFKLS